ncbi:hypothetical protein NQ314_017762 [Rhamnusium bicolor]|uniref:Mitochondrial carrier protein n=1 Tax=Rhamnusium bicolor TaxID=1586634 RepID=A0AAV8WS38_9CUCU|nr:hypothetical protein NQ314_017762 [Rhamnusium bicolor]
MPYNEDIPTFLDEEEIRFIEVQLYFQQFQLSLKFHQYVAGTTGAIVTCPLEVVKTRQQSSRNNFIIVRDLENIPGESSLPKTTCRTVPDQRRRLWTTSRYSRPQVVALSGYTSPPSQIQSPSIVQCLKHIIQHEGPMALFKGLGPNLIGVAPSRAVYFCTYSQAKLFCNSFLPPDSPIVHVCSASCAGFMASTLTNPIWFVKTRLQLDLNRNSDVTAMQVVRRIYAKTITGLGRKSSKDFLEFMVAGAISKTVASCIAYPHEVARTRLREEGSKYRAFWQTLGLVYKEEGLRGIYRGLTTQLVRQIPNTAIMMSTYEAVVYILTMKFNTEFYSKEEEH